MCAVTAMPAGSTSMPHPFHNKCFYWINSMLASFSIFVGNFFFSYILHCLAVNNNIMIIYAACETCVCLYVHIPHAPHTTHERESVALIRCAIPGSGEESLSCFHGQHRSFAVSKCQWTPKSLRAECPCVYFEYYRYDSIYIFWMRADAKRSQNRCGTTTNKARAEEEELATHTEKRIAWI